MRGGDLGQPVSVLVSQRAGMMGRPAERGDGMLCRVGTDGVGRVTGRRQVTSRHGNSDQVGHQVVTQVPQTVPANVLPPCLPQEGRRFARVAFGVGGQCQRPRRHVRRLAAR